MKIRQKLGQSQELLDLVFDKKNIEVEDDQIDKYIYPYDYIPLTVTDASTFIGIEIDIPRTINSTVKDVLVYFYISVHKSLMSPEFRNGVRTDLLVSEIDNVMNKSRDFGIGRCDLNSLERFYPQESFCGRVLIYKMKDFNKVGV